MSEQNSFTALDFETANSSRTSICSIGLVRVEDGRITRKIHSLVNPCQPFQYWNTQIHGISAFDVRDAPTFPEIWERLGGFFGDVVVAHNAAFDISCLKQTIEKYGLEYPNFSYFCTLCISRKFVDAPSHKLDDMARHFKLPSFNHHNALADALACAEIFIKLKTSCDISAYRKNFLAQRGAAAKIAAKTKAAKANVFGGGKRPAEIGTQKPEQKSLLFDECDIPDRRLSAALSAARKFSPVGRISRSAMPRPITSVKPQSPFFFGGRIDFSKAFRVVGRFADMTIGQVESLILRRGGSIADCMEEYPNYVVVGSRRDFSIKYGDDYPDDVYIAKKADIPVVDEKTFLAQILD